MMVMNPWINKNIEAVRDYFTDLIEVAEPDEYLQVSLFFLNSILTYSRSIDIWN